MGGKKLKDFEAGLADNADVVVLRKEVWQGLLLQVVGSMYRVRAPLGSILRIPLHALLSGAMLLRQACWSLLNLVGNEYITEFHFASLFHSLLISTMSSIFVGLLVLGQAGLGRHVRGMRAITLRSAVRGHGALGKHAIIVE